MNFRKKGGRIYEFSGKGEGGPGGHSNPKIFVADFCTPEKKRNIVFRNEGGGDQRPFGSFLKIHPKWAIESSVYVILLLDEI